MTRWLGMRMSEPMIISVARRPTLSTSRPAKGAKIMEAKMTMLVMPGAVPNMWKRLKKVWLRKLPALGETSGIPHLVEKRCVDRAVKGKMAE